MCDANGVTEMWVGVIVNLNNGKARFLRGWMGIGTVGVPDIGYVGFLATPLDQGLGVVDAGCVVIVSV